MTRRVRGGLIDDVHTAGSEPDGHETIEILGLGSSGQHRNDEVLTVEPRSSGPDLAKLAIAALGAVAALGVITAGNTPAPEPPAPSVTVPPTTVPAAVAEQAATIAELEAIYGVEIGDGPELEWEPIIWNIGSTEFAWINDGFVGDNGETEWTIRPTQLGPSIGQRQSLAVENPGYSVIVSEGARLLVPTAPDHALIAISDHDLVRVDFPRDDTEPRSDLVERRRRWHGGVTVGDRVVVTTTTVHQFNLETLGERVGRDLGDVTRIEVDDDRLRLSGPEPIEAISFEDAGFTQAELADFSLLAGPSDELWIANTIDGQFEPLELDNFDSTISISRTQSGAAVTWFDSDGQSWLSTSTTGETWSTGPVTINGELSLAGRRFYDVASDETRSIRRSADQGRTWQRTYRPFERPVDAAAIDDVLVVLRSPQRSIGNESMNPGDTMTFEVDDYDVQISAAGRVFELIDPTSGESVFQGTIDDSASGVAFDPFGAGLAISDPTSGQELLSVPQGALLRAFAEASGAAPAELAVTRWGADQDDPEWHIEPLSDVFHDAVDAAFVPGEGYLLAVVTTSTGTNFYVAATTR